MSFEWADLEWHELDQDFEVYWSFLTFPLTVICFHFTSQESECLSTKPFAHNSFPLDWRHCFFQCDTFVFCDIWGNRKVSCIIQNNETMYNIFWSISGFILYVHSFTLINTYIFYIIFWCLLRWYFEHFHMF